LIIIIKSKIKHNIIKCFFIIIKTGMKFVIIKKIYKIFVKFIKIYKLIITNKEKINYKNLLLKISNINRKIKYHKH
jgi:flagellar motor component MotA